MGRITSRPGSPPGERNNTDEPKTTTVRVHKPDKALVDFLMRTRGYPTTADATRAIFHEWAAYRMAMGENRSEFPIPVLVEVSKLADELDKLNEKDLAHFIRQFETIVRSALRKPHATAEAVNALMEGLHNALRVFLEAEDLTKAPQLRLVPSAQRIAAQASLPQDEE